MILLTNISENWPEYLLKALILILVFMIGSTIFSYLNLIIEELPREDAEETLKSRLLKKENLCPHCGHKWKLKESIPVISWLAARRKCNYCFEKISSRHTLIELLGGLLAAAVVIYYGISFAALTVFLVFVVLTLITFIDMDTQYIPPVLNIILGVLGIISIWSMPGVSVFDRAVGFVCISLPLLLIVLIVPDGFGGGDIKLMSAAGILLGWKGNVVAFFIGLVLGGAYGIYLLAVRKKGKKEHFAFGPFLSIGIAISLYAGVGTYLMNKYLGLISQMMHR